MITDPNTYQRQQLDPITINNKTLDPDPDISIALGLDPVFDVCADGKN